MLLKCSYYQAFVVKSSIYHQVYCTDWKIFSGELKGGHYQQREVTPDLTPPADFHISNTSKTPSRSLFFLAFATDIKMFQNRCLSRSTSKTPLPTVMIVVKILTMIMMITNMQMSKLLIGREADWWLVSPSCTLLMSAGSIEERERRFIIMRIEPTSHGFPPKY